MYCDLCVLSTVCRSVYTLSDSRKATQITILPINKHMHTDRHDACEIGSRSREIQSSHTRRVDSPPRTGDRTRTGGRFGFARLQHTCARALRLSLSACD